MRYRKRRKKWCASIMVDGISKSLGSHDKMDDAVLARYKAEVSLNWSGCDSSSPAYRYCLENNLIRGKGGVLSPE